MTDQFEIVNEPDGSGTIVHGGKVIGKIHLTGTHTEFQPLNLRDPQSSPFFEYERREFTVHGISNETPYGDVEPDRLMGGKTAFSARIMASGQETGPEIPRSDLTLFSYGKARRLVAARDLGIDITELTEAVYLDWKAAHGG